MPLGTATQGEGRFGLTELRDTLAIVFLTLSVIGIPNLVARGGSIPGVAILPAAAALLIGHALGVTAHNRVPIRRLERTLEVVLMTAALASIAGAAAFLA